MPTSLCNVFTRKGKSLAQARANALCQIYMQCGALFYSHSKDGNVAVWHAILCHMKNIHQCKKTAIFCVAFHVNDRHDGHTRRLKSLQHRSRLRVTLPYRVENVLFLTSRAKALQCPGAASNQENLTCLGHCVCHLIFPAT